jgi:uncharacterized protein YfaT (DUF1175 family)
VPVWARLVAILAAASLIAGVGWFATSAQPERAGRPEILERARSWTDEAVPYSKVGYKDGYRRDCSGFVSMAWGLPENLTTWRIPLVAREIAKEELEPGDVLLDFTSDDRHVVIFEKWANKAKTEYWAMESSGHKDVRAAVRRVLPYPYPVNESHYKPYRFVGMDGYWDKVKENERQPVEGVTESIERDAGGS